MFGLFEDETRVSVGSQAFNLAGDLVSRPNFLKTTIVTSVLADENTVGSSITNALLTGPGATYKRFADWAKRSGYNDSVGNALAYTFSKEFLSEAAFAAIVPVPSGKETKLVYSDIDTINLTYLARQYIYANAPAYRNDNFKVSYDTVISGNLLITYSDTSTVSFTPPVSIINPVNTKYVYIEYATRNIIPPIEYPVPVWTVVDTEGGLPSTVGCTGSYVDNISLVTLSETTTVDVSYNIIYPPTHDVATVTVGTPSFNSKTANFTKTTYLGDISSIGYISTEYILQIEYYYVIHTTTTVNTVVEEYDEGLNHIIKTTVTTVVTDVLVPKYRYKQTYTDTISENWDVSQYAVYQIGTNETIDPLVLFGVTSVTGQYFPVVPIRRDNKFVDKDNFPSQYTLSAKAVKKLFGKNILPKLFDNLATNPQINELDNAWIVFGVSLGTQQESGKEYIYQFFKSIIDSTPAISGYATSAAEFISQWETYNLAVSEYTTTIGIEGITVPPIPPSPPVLQSYSFTTNAYDGTGWDWLYNVSISFSGGGKTLGSGYHAKSGSKVNTTWAYISGTATINVATIENVFDEGATTVYTPTLVNIIKIGKQLTESSWEEYELLNLVHKNIVYQGYSVTTVGDTAISTMNENSSFIVPLNEYVFDAMSSIGRTQLALESSFLVINYYTVTTIPWYQTGFFQVVLIAAIIVTAVYTGYIGPNSAGVLGTNAAVGTAITGAAIATTAVVVIGAIANALAAAIIAILITEASTSMFGEDVGRIIAFVATVVVMYGMTNGFNFDSNAMMHEMTKAENLIKLSMSAMDSYSQYLSVKVGELGSEYQQFMSDHEARMKELRELTASLSPNGSIGVNQLIEATKYVVESEDSFLRRTLMTGDDIVNVTLDLVNKFPEPQSQLKLAI